MRTLTVLIFAILFIAISCKKDKEENAPSASVPVETPIKLIEDYILHPLGTKLVFKNNGEIDTLTLIKQDTTALITGAPASQQVYIYEQEYTSSLHPYGINNEVEFPYEDDFNLKVQVYRGAYYLLHNQTDTTSYLGVKLEETLSSYTVNGVSYSNVRHFSYKDSDYPNVNTECYLAKDYGAIKTFVIEDGDTIENYVLLNKIGS